MFSLFAAKLHSYRLASGHQSDSNHNDDTSWSLASNRTSQWELPTSPSPLILPCPGTKNFRRWERRIFFPFRFDAFCDSQQYGPQLSPDPHPCPTASRQFQATGVWVDPKESMSFSLKDLVGSPHYPMW